MVQRKVDQFSKQETQHRFEAALAFVSENAVGPASVADQIDTVTERQRQRAALYAVVDEDRRLSKNLPRDDRTALGACAGSSA